MVSKEQALKALEDVSAYEVIRRTWSMLPEHGSGTAYTVLDLRDGLVKSYYVPSGAVDEDVEHEIVLYSLKNSRAYIIEEIFWGEDIDEDMLDEEDVLDELAERYLIDLLKQLLEQHYQAE